MNSYFPYLNSSLLTRTFFLYWMYHSLSDKALVYQTTEFCVNLHLWHIYKHQNDDLHPTPSLCLQLDSPWWRHQMKTFSALLALSAGNSPVNSKASDAELWYFLRSAPWINGWVNSREAGDWSRHRAHYGVTVMWYKPMLFSKISFNGTFQWDVSGLRFPTLAWS